MDNIEREAFLRWMCNQEAIQVLGTKGMKQKFKGLSVGDAFRVLDYHWSSAAPTEAHLFIQFLKVKHNKKLETRKMWITMREYKALRGVLLKGEELERFKEDIND